MSGTPTEKPLRICFFGNYDPKYIRTMVIMRGLREHGCHLLECNDQQRGLKSYLSLIKQHQTIKGNYDVVLVGNSGVSRSYVLLAKLLSRKTVIWDAHYSLYDAYVYDREVVKRFSVKGGYHWLMDWLATTLADRVYLDTNAHMMYFIKLFNANPKKFFYVFVGADEDMFHPQEKNDDHSGTFIVEFHGKYIPLQGVEYIIQAAKLLESDSDIQFILIGNGQTYASSRALADKLGVKNIKFIDKVPYEEIPRYIVSGDVCLGIFGKGDKTQRVIPNKLYEAVALGKPVITAKTPAIIELFTDNKDIVLCEAGNAEDLARSINKLKNDLALRQLLQQNVRALYLNKLTPKAIVSELVTAIALLVK